MNNTCETLYSSHPPRGRLIRCTNRASMKVTMDAPFPYNIMCCKKHVRKVCIEAIDADFNFQVFQRSTFGAIETFIHYPLHNINNLPERRVPVQRPVVPVPVQRPVVPVPVQPPVVPVPVQPPAVVLNLTPVLDEGQHSCCICFEDTDDVFCTTKRHTLCHTCFSMHVVSESQRPEFDGTVKCPSHRMNECDCEGFTVSFIAKHTDDHTFNEFDRNRYNIKEKNAISKFQEDFQKKLQLEQTQSTSHKDMVFVLENIFTLKCPHCSAAYAEFDGCLAITCSTCMKHFCGKCNQACSSKQYAHHHAHHCVFAGCSKGYFQSKTNIKMCQNALRKQRMDEFLKNKPNKFEILQLLKKDMADIGL
uniref:Uncharacterized protein n=1 Tax=Pyramimonas orientalis virus TaxID=455367 RepID=A0A7M3UPC4_POV01|nr:hypothetical protein HWQ62_00474 [Pyramimonas orientalis virus]